MAFVNLPANLQDIFGSITDRIAKLETGPSSAQTDADTAQATAVSAQTTAISAQSTAMSAALAAASASAQALTAQTTAATAQGMATIADGKAVTAQATAASASAQALTAQTTAATAQGMATIADGKAVTAQATAAIALAASTVASAQAITATNTANAAASQATIAQSQATIAQSTAVAAQTSANGKNVIHYSTTTPGTTANIVGDIWYQYGTSGTYLNKVIAQWSGAGGTSWTSVTVSGLVLANLDAGAITTGTLSAIEISGGSGGTAFHVSPAGYMSAQGAYIKGNITADSGTFNGQVNASSGYFGSLTNGWQINSGGITGLGSGYISGGAIQGTSFYNGSGTFYVNAAGDMVAQSVYIKGAILGTSGYFGSSTNGWQINSDGITGIGSGYIAGGAIQGTSFNNGSGTFYVNAAGDMVAQSVYIKGAILGTSGYFGSSTNGWNINGAGITGIGSGYIAGGAIQGTSFNNNSGTFLVTSAGALTATDATITGTITANSGTIGGFTVGQVAGVGSYLYSGNLTLNSAGTITGTNTSTIYYGYANIGGGTAGSERLIVTGNSNFAGTIISTGSITGQSSATFGSGGGWKYLDSSGVMRVPATYSNTVSTRAVYVNSVGDFGTVSSSQRFKHEIVDYSIDQDSLLALNVKAFKFNEDKDPEQLQQYGFIAEQAEELGLEQLIQRDNEGKVDYFAYERLPVFLFQVIKDQEARIKALEAK